MLLQLYLYMYVRVYLEYFAFHFHFKSVQPHAFVIRPVGWQLFPSLPLSFYISLSFSPSRVRTVKWHINWLLMRHWMRWDESILLDPQQRLTCNLVSRIFYTLLFRLFLSLSLFPPPAASIRSNQSPSPCLSPS